MHRNSQNGSEEKPQNDVSLVSRVKDDCCEDSLKEIIHRHSKLYYKISQKYSSRSISCGVRANDIDDDKDYTIYQAILSYDPTRDIKFSTWLGNCVRYKCLNFINKNNRIVKTDDDTIEYFYNKQSVEAFNSIKVEDENEYIFNILKQLKDKRIHRVFTLRYFSGEKKMTWSKIAKNLDVSTQTAINLHNKGREVLRKKYTTQDMSRSDLV